MKNKVLVCITIQENSRRLITEGHNKAQSLDAPLHLLHIRKGDTVFDNADSSNLLEDLFAFGGELGGEVHFLCSNHIPNTITEFITNNKITHLIMGAAPTTAHLTEDENIYTTLKNKLNNIEITVLNREEIH